MVLIDCLSLSATCRSLYLRVCIQKFGSAFNSELKHTESNTFMWDFFFKLNDIKTSIHFYVKCLSVFDSCHAAQKFSFEQAVDTIINQYYILLDLSYNKQSL